MLRSVNNPWLHRFAVVTALATLALIGIGGLVTSHGAGMSVPDWPTSYDYNMFLFPLSRWWHGGNIFYEHSHRLFASGVGLLTSILAFGLWFKESRRWVRWLGAVAFVCVVLQGVLGGLRVVLLKDQIGVFHAALAQLFFVLVCAIALVTGKWWQSQAGPAAMATAPPRREVASRLRRLYLAATLLIFVQLVLGAVMRHQHAGLAIPDFPLAYGRLWPATDPDSVTRYNARRIEITAANPITAFQINLQMTHRLVALAILAAVAAGVWLGFQKPGPRHSLVRLSAVWLGLIGIQLGLGVATVLTDKAADVATAHVVLGALSLATGSLLSIASGRRPEFARTVPAPAAQAGRAEGRGSLAAGIAAAQS